MKKIIICLTAWMFTMYISQAQVKQTKEDFLKQMTAVGEAHNNALESIYNALLKNPGPLNTNASNAEKIKYLNEIISSTPPFNPMPAAIAEIMNTNLDMGSSALLQSLDRNETRSLYEIIIAKAGLSDEEMHFYNSLNNIIDSYSNDLPSLQKSISDFNESVFVKFGINSNSTLALIAGSCVAQASANYWFLNSEKWKQLKYGIASKNAAKQPDCGKKVLKADAAGAVTGGVSGAAVGSVAGGIGAAPGAVAGATVGAVTGSTGAAVSCLIDWLWP